MDQKEIPVEDRLKALYELQTVLTEIDRICILRGELPYEVQDLEDELQGLQTRVANSVERLKECEANIAANKNAISEAKIKIANTTEQQNNVRNSREYDALSKEIYYQELQIQLYEKKIRENESNCMHLREEIEKADERINERQLDLEHKKSELEEIVTENKQEEERLRAQAKELESRIGQDDRYLIAFKRIRKNARNGLGIVQVERKACGGCFNKIPPQREMDIKLHKKVIVCEYCGRILIDSDLAAMTTNKE